MNNSRFVDDENIPLVNDEDIDYDDYDTPNTSWSFAMPHSTDKETILRLKQKVKQDKLTALYRNLNVTGNLDLINIDQFKLTFFDKTNRRVFCTNNIKG